ncbi:adenylate cyclase type 7 [Gracilinanus agilis]|uniref:adenylate cyclase type 7 n=1 Tax=Gracilinanus agilis TaxID=191870 RepID=UPI001CFF24F5|nr:adenylate cyclase type 7 [Gracilinanus agilis]
MPTKGKYFLNDDEEWKSKDSRYEQFHHMSQHYPFLLIFLSIAIISSLILIVLSFFHSNRPGHQTFLATAFLTLILFAIIYALVYVECLFQKWLKFFAVVIWICFLTLGFVLIFDFRDKKNFVWEQVPFFLFIIFTVYTMLPFEMKDAIVVNVLSTLSYLLVVGVRAEVFKAMPPLPLVLQVRSNYKLCPGSGEKRQLFIEQAPEVIVQAQGGHYGRFTASGNKPSHQPSFLWIGEASQQQQPPSNHLSKPRANDALKMRASVRMTRYLESWGAARPFASLNHRESLSTEILIPRVKRIKTIPIRRHRDADRNAPPKGKAEEDTYDEELMVTIEGLSLARPCCCGNSDDFYTIGTFFVEKNFEKEYRTMPVPRVRNYFACAGFVFFCLLLIHTLVMPKTAEMGVSFGIVACVMLLVLVACFADDFLRFCPEQSCLHALRTISEKVETEPLLRLSLAVLTIGSLLTVAIVNLLFLPPSPKHSGNTTELSHRNSTNIECFVLPYYVYSCILAFIACSMFLRMSLELKVVMLTASAIAYLTIFNTRSIPDCNSCLDGDGDDLSDELPPRPSLPSCLTPLFMKDLKIMVNFYLILFYVTLILLSKQIDYYYRLDYLWKNKFKKEQEEFETMKNVNHLLLENVLPTHVAEHFIGDKLTEDWYHQSYDCVCVMFASVPDFKVFYTECDVNKEGLECLRLLNEIIADFDELLLKPKFSGVEKIKTIGSTYMAAAGLSLTPGQENNQDQERQHAHIGIMVEYSIALMNKLDGINRHSFNTFRLRVGINHGPVIAGVIGARKPQYDIWGNTVNVASRMESTGELGKIQVTEETCNILQKLGYSCECRGLINVKGKGELRTYFVCTDTTKFQGMGLN